MARSEDKTIMPTSFIPSIIVSPITAYRWHSLTSIGGDDDFFSSDPSDSALQSNFGKLDQPTLVSMSEKDEMVPPFVNKEALLERWTKAISGGLASEQSQVISTADHELSEEGVARYFIELAVKFLEELDQEPAGTLLS